MISREGVEPKREIIEFPPPRKPVRSGRALTLFTAVPLFGAFFVGVLLGWFGHGSKTSRERGTSDFSEDAAASLQEAGGPRGETAASGAGRREAKPLPPAVRQIEVALRRPTEFARSIHAVVATSRLRLADIPAALAFAQSLGTSEIGTVVTSGTVARWAELDPRAAARWVTDHHSDESTAPLLSNNVIGEWVAVDRQAARKWIESLAPRDASRARAAYFGAMGAVRPDEGLKELSTLAPSDQREARKNFFASWAGLRPHEALEAARSQADPDARSAALQAALTAWGQREPRAAIAAALKVESSGMAEGKSAADLAALLLNDWARSDPTGALSELMGLPASVRDQAAGDVFARALAADPEQAREALQRMPPGRGTVAATAVYAGSLAARDPAGAIDVLDTLPDGAERERAFGAVCDAWARHDAAAAGAWLLQLPEGKDRSAGVSALINQWTDLPAAGAWLRQLPPGADYDSAVALYSGQLPPAEAVAWAATIGEARQREQVITKYAVRWMELDPEKARAWVRQTSIIGADLRSWLLRSQ